MSRPGIYSNQWFTSERGTTKLASEWFESIQELQEGSRPSSVFRAPTPADDVTSGYRVGDIWLAPNKALYTCRRNTAGAAMWELNLAAVPLAGDATTGLAAAYGVRRVVTAYGTGPAFRAFRSSDNTTLDIPFLPTGEVDWAKADAFTRNTSGYVCRWYDQSGAAQHTVEATDVTKMPRISKVRHIGNSRPIHFDNPYNVTGGPKIRRALTLPGTLSLTSNSLSIVSLAACAHSTRHSPLVEIGTYTGTDTAYLFGHNSQAGVDAICAWFSTRRALPKFNARMTPFVSGTASGTGATGITVFGGDNDKSPVYGAGGTTVLTGGIIGGSAHIAPENTNDYGNNLQGALLIYNRPISFTEYQAIAAALHVDFDVAPQVRAVWVAEGDSITEEPQAPELQGYVRRAAAMLTVPRKVYNVAISGGTVVTSQPGTTTKWTGLYSSATTPDCIATLAAGTNDLGAGSTAEQIFAADGAWLAKIRAEGFQGKAYVMTVLPRDTFIGDPAKEVQRQLLNDMRRTRYADAGFAGCIDIAADPTMGAASAPLDTTLYPDGTHPEQSTGGGDAYLAQVVAAFINDKIPG